MVSGLIARWNVLHDGSAQLLNTAPDFVDEKAAAFVGAMLIAQAAHFVVVHRYRVLGAVLGGFWIALGLADGCFSRRSCSQACWRSMSRISVCI